MPKNLQSLLCASNDWYYTYKKQLKLSTNIPIKDKLLYQEIESACQKRSGILTYEEYLTIDQFGKYGYYATNKKHGATDIDTRWGNTLAYYCRQYGHATIIEFGCGAGELGIATVKAYKKITGENLTWIGVEIDKGLHEKIYTNFRINKISDAIGAVVATLDELPNLQNPLIVFPYSLDSIPPHVFLNTKPTNSYPDALLGIKAEKGMLSEVIIPQEILQKKSIKLENGLFAHNGITFKLSGWKLYKGQRAYIATNAFDTIYAYAKKFDDASMIIIDEFRNAPWNFSLGNLGTPKSLYEKNLAYNQRKRYFRESGKHNLYYPLYKDSILKFLTLLGFRSIEVDIEQKMASELRSKPWFSLSRNYGTYAFIAKDFVAKKMNGLPIPSPQKKLL